MESMKALRKVGRQMGSRQRAQMHTMQALIQSITRVPLHFGLLLSTLDIVQRAEQIAGAKVVNLHQMLLSLFTGFHLPAA